MTLSLEEQDLRGKQSFVALDDDNNCFGHSSPLLRAEGELLIVAQSGGDYKGGRMKAFKGASSRVRCQWTACGTKLVHIVNIVRSEHGWRTLA